MKITEKIRAKLNSNKIIWFSSINNTKPHLIPIWFVVNEDMIWICSNSNSVKSRNIRKNRNVSISLEEGTKPLIGEGFVNKIETTSYANINKLFIQKYDWDISRDDNYDDLLGIVINKWIKFNGL